MRPPGSRHSTVPKQKPAKEQRTGTPLPPRGPRPLPAPRVPTPRPQPRREIGRIFEETETSLVDVIDNLLNRGVVLNADLILALADVDLVYVRLSALLCAADRVWPSVR
jgi:gas vesicle protein GvpA/GvpJ/GvpM family